MPDWEKVIKWLEEISDYFFSVYHHSKDREEIDKAKDMCDAVEDAISLLKEQEAKTGHWIEKEDYNLDTYYDCSVCGESWTMIDGTPLENGMNYCPHCGAKMEGR